MRAAPVHFGARGFAQGDPRDTREAFKFESPA